MSTWPTAPVDDQYGKPWVVLQKDYGCWALGFDEKGMPCLREIDAEGSFLTDWAHVRPVRTIQRWPDFMKPANRNPDPTP